MSSDQAVISVRVAQAQERAEERLRHQRDLLRPLGWAVIAVVVAGVLTQQPGPGRSATGIAITVATLAYAAATAAAISNRFLARSDAIRVAIVVGMALAGVTLSWLQPRGASDVAAGAAAWMAVTRLRVEVGIAITVGVGIAGAAAAGRTGSPSTVLAVLLLTGLLALVAYMVRQGRDSQAHTEVLLAELADARDAQAQAAVVAERSKIAAELHDVLAHALSGAALQLQGARMLAEQQDAGPVLTEAIQRAAHLVADGLVNAREAVGALRGAGISPVAQLERLVDDCRRDLKLDATLHVQGAPHPLPPAPALALYRGVEEALTNAARYPPRRIYPDPTHLPAGANNREHREHPTGARPRSVGRRRSGCPVRVRGRQRPGRDAGTDREHRRHHARRTHRTGLAGRLGRPHPGRVAMTGPDPPGPSSARLRVLIADDQRVVRDGLTLVLGLLDGVDVVGAVGDGAQAIEQTATLAPDVILMDLHMPVLDGIEATRTIRVDHPKTQVLVLSTYAEDADLLPALRAGATGYLTKDATAEEIQRALVDVAAGRTHLDPTIQQRLVASLLDSRARPAPGASEPSMATLDGLTAREIEVLKLIAGGLSNTEIAHTLVLSNATVKTHINHIFTKTGVRDRSQAVRYAYEHHLDP
ncbi:helix-turn-helix transcriptional regulator [Pedococcus sp. 5OH_020]|uniref:helix-turn-helix transcriptional regulator n=1 Tax=Pedococcus sp. 5OH_020 TaxID=2989814 RepID=UPI0022E9EC01|nr:response regulator transcription factor family protein [Pedococcus sp. 5OH_020]